MEFHSCDFPGVRIIDLPHHTDTRGEFVKLYHDELYQSSGIHISFVEDFYSRSTKGVLRGMHFQYAPYAHWKLVTCVEGSVLDIGFDMRTNSPTFGRWFEHQLSSTTPQAILLPPGFAHGFLTTSDSSTVFYKCSTVQCPQAEAGIMWNSFGFQWPISNPTLSNRDSSLPPWKTLARDPRLADFRA